MAEPDFDVSYLDRRNRLTVAFRGFLAIPHTFLQGAWGSVAQLSALCQWFVIVFTGRRNEGLYRFNNAYLEYSARVVAYTSLLHDTWPGFLTERRGEPVHYRLDYQPAANRLTTALRMIWVIPATVVLMIFAFAAAFVQLVAWFVIIISGQLPRGMFDFVVKVTRLSLATSAYLLLQTDQYPLTDWRGGPTGALPPGDFSDRPADGARPVPASPGWSPPTGPPAG